MNVVLPTWFKGRQGKAEPAGENLLKLTGPNLVEGCIGIRPAEDGGWNAFVRGRADGEDLASTTLPLSHPTEAWGAAFELFRNHFIA